ncbi:unnamed protein product [Phyllotreta striolata]|uniref:Cytochrome b561 domain-containing protein n=1 Tax=Phyllotreta striolata TaxID=444603 RepID=A0A9N9TFC7_PHYSR|nr:unnamed protein product [Phyllotreta striolata]
MDRMCCNCPYRKQYFSCYLIATVIGIFTFMLLLIWLFAFKNGLGFKTADLIFNWHPLLMTLGMIFMFSHAILFYRTGTICNKNCLKMAHGISQFAVILFAILGLIAVFSNHIMNGIPNMYSLHSWLGLTVILIFMLNFAFGFYFFFYPKADAACRKAALPYHVRVGIVCFILAIITAVTGIGEKAIFSISNYKDMPLEGALCNLLGFMFIIYGLTILYLVMEPCYKRAEAPAAPCLQQPQPRKFAPTYFNPYYSYPRQCPTRYTQNVFWNY